MRGELSVNQGGGVSESEMGKRVLITGANGFVGSHIVDALLREGYDVRAMVRTTSDLTWLTDKPVELSYASLQDKKSLEGVVKDVDFIIHNAGVVSQPHTSLYFMHNTEGTQRLYEVAAQENPGIERFVYVSSQAATGPATRGFPKSEAESAVPITPYGKSKFHAENWLKRHGKEIPWTVIRPPSVYGPRDKAFLPLFKMLAMGVAPEIGSGQTISIIHVQDLARQVLLQMTHPAAVGEIFHASPYDPITSGELSSTIGQVLGVQPKPITIPAGLLRYGFPFVYPLLNLFDAAPFRPDKLPEMLETNWLLSGRKAKKLLDFEGNIPLAAGIGQTAEWYRWKGWLTTRRDKLKRRGKNCTEIRDTGVGEKTYNGACDLCGLTFDGEIKTRKHYEDDDFIVVDCLICRVPMAVLKDHRSEFTDDEKARLRKMFFDLFGSLGDPDWEQRRIPEHAHVHFRKHGRILPWQRRPDDKPRES